MKRARDMSSSHEAGIIERHLISKALHYSSLNSELELHDVSQIPNLNRILDDTQTDALIVLRRGKIVYEYHNRTCNHDSVHKLRSMTKSIVGLVTGILAHQGKLRPQDRVSDYVPEVLGTLFGTTTIRDCLDMRLGFAYDDAALPYRQAAGLASLRVDDKPTDIRSFLLSVCVADVSQTEAVNGTPFNYTAIATDLLGWVLERTTGMRFANIVSTLLWKPLGAESNASIRADPAGNAFATAGMSATLYDMARVAQLMLRDDNGIVPASWVQDILTNGSIEAFEESSWKSRFSDISSDLSYRAYWVVDRKSQLLISPGAFGQMMIVDRLNQMVMVKFSSQPSGMDERKSRLTVRLFKEFQRVLGVHVSSSPFVDSGVTPQDNEHALGSEPCRVNCAHFGAKDSPLRGVGAEVVGY